MPVSVTGTIVDAGGNVIKSGAFVRFQLKGTQNIQPFVTGVGALATGVGTGRDWFVDFLPDPTTGIVSGSVYSTRDSTGLLAGEIAVNGNGLACWYEVAIVRGARAAAKVHIDAKTGTTLDIGNLTARSPVLTQPIPPSTDLTYARLDAGNTPFTGLIQFLQGLILGAGKLLAWGSSGTGSVDTGLSRTATKTIAVGNGTQGDATGTVNAANVAVTSALTTKGTVTLQKSDGTLPATITNDTAGGVQITNNAGQSNRLIDASGNMYVGAGKALILFGGTSGSTSLVASAIAGSTALTIPAANDTLVGKATTDTLTNKALTSPAISDPTITGNTNVKRVKANQGNALVVGDFVLGAGWGSTASIAGVSGNDSIGQVSILSNGTGQTVNPAVTLTFHDGTWTVAPLMICVRADGNSPQAAVIPNTMTGTTAIFFFNGTPVAGTTYVVNFICVGR